MADCLLLLKLNICSVFINIKYFFPLKQRFSFLVLTCKRRSSLLYFPSCDKHGNGLKVKIELFGFYRNI